MQVYVLAVKYVIALASKSTFLTIKGCLFPKIRIGHAKEPNGVKNKRKYKRKQLKRRTYVKRSSLSIKPKVVLRQEGPLLHNDTCQKNNHVELHQRALLTPFW